MKRFISIHGWWCMCLLCVSAFSQSNITRVEYFIDVDPGYGNGTSITIPATNNIVDQTFDIDPTGLSLGVHIIGIRAADADGKWSYDYRWLIVKPYDALDGPGTQGNIVLVEYYIDTDPGYGNATPVTITPGTNLSDILLNINSGALTADNHVLAIRSLDANGNWSHDNIWEFDVSSTLPVNMLNFGARYADNAVVLDWKTASEFNASHFIIERSSNGISFEPIGKVAASGNSSSIKNYSFIDKTAIAAGSAKLYYRLKKVDLDQKSDYSKTVSIILSDAELFTVGPNPAANIINLRYKVSQTSSKALLQITDIGGKTVISQRIFQGKNLHTINIANLTKGTYILTVTDKNTRLTKRFVKQ